MNKQVLSTLSVLALAAVATPAVADFKFGDDERNVTVYGRIDLGIVRENRGESYLNQGGGSLATGKTQMHPGADSWFGVNAEMMLDDGFKSYLKVQQRFRADTGAELNSASQFHGWSYIGLQKIGFGAIELGRQYMPAAYIALNADPFRWDTVANISNMSLGYAKGSLGSGYTASDGPRYKNGVIFKSDRINGFQASLGASLKQENTLSTPAVAGKSGVGSEYGATVEYISGPLYAGIGYDHTSSNPNVPAANLTTGQNLTIGTVAYDFGVIKPMASAAVTRVGVAGGTLEAKAMSLGAIAPIGSKGELKGLAARVSQDGPGAQDLTKYGIGYHHFLKRVRTDKESYFTKVYIDAATARGTNPDLTRTNAIDVGVMVAF